MFGWWGKSRVQRLIREMEVGAFVTSVATQDLLRTRYPGDYALAELSAILTRPHADRNVHSSVVWVLRNWFGEEQALIRVLHVQRACKRVYLGLSWFKTPALLAVFPQVTEPDEHAILLRAMVVRNDSTLTRSLERPRDESSVVALTDFTLDPETPTDDRRRAMELLTRWVGEDAIALRLLGAGGTGLQGALALLKPGTLLAPIRQGKAPEGWECLVRACFLEAHWARPDFRFIPRERVIGPALEALLDRSIPDSGKDVASKLLSERLGPAGAVDQLLEHHAGHPDCVAALTHFVGGQVLHTAWKACPEGPRKEILLRALLARPYEQLVPDLIEVGMGPGTEGPTRHAAFGVLAGFPKGVEALAGEIEAGGPFALAAVRALALNSAPQAAALLARVANDQARPVPLRRACVLALGLYCPPLIPGEKDAGGLAPWAQKLADHLVSWAASRLPRPADLDVVRARLMAVVAAEASRWAEEVVARTTAVRDAKAALAAAEDAVPADRCFSCGGQGFTQHYTMPATGNRHLHANAYDMMREQTKKKTECTSCDGKGYRRFLLTNAAVNAAGDRLREAERRAAEAPPPTPALDQARRTDVLSLADEQTIQRVGAEVWFRQSAERELDRLAGMGTVPVEPSK